MSEMIKTLAEEVCGLKLAGEQLNPHLGVDVLMPCKVRKGLMVETTWNPLESDADCAMLKEAFVGKYKVFKIETSISGDSGAYVEFGLWVKGGTAYYVSADLIKPYTAAAERKAVV
jgi:hypothetical protein